MLSFVGNGRKDEIGGIEVNKIDVWGSSGIE
jgi:hypothetical protein